MMMDLKRILHNVLLEEQTNLNDNNFIKWFGNSKVIRGDKPIICYHGTNSRFDSFNASQSTKHVLSYDALGWGFYFSDRDDDAGEYGNIIMRCYLKIEHPFINNRLTPRDYFAEKNNIMFPKTFSDYNNKPKGYYDDFNNISPEMITKFLIGEGFDGIIRTSLGSTEFVCFNPNQIKSVDNDGSWDINDNNIYS